MKIYRKPNWCCVSIFYWWISNNRTNIACRERGFSRFWIKVSVVLFDFWQCILGALDWSCFPHQRIFWFLFSTKLNLSSFLGSHEMVLIWITFALCVACVWLVYIIMCVCLSVCLVFVRKIFKYVCHPIQ